MKKNCQITLYLDTPKPLLRPFRDFAKHNQLASLIMNGVPDPAEVTGHAFIGLSDGKGREIRVGYTGEGKMSKMISGVEGVVIPHDNQDYYNEAIVWNISKKQFNAAKREIEKQQKNPGTYKLFERNCSTFATDVLKAAKVEDVPEGKLGLTPYGLILKKRVMLAKRRMEVLKFKAKNVLRTLFGKKRAPTSALLQSLRSKPVPVPIRVGTNDYRAKSTCKQLHPLDVKAITAKLAFTKE